MTDKPQGSPVEGIKQASRQLRGEIAQELVDGQDFFGNESIQLLKHHGTYQQDNRDDRAAARASGVTDKKAGKTFSFMVRTKLPGGRLTSAQLLAELDMADEVGNTTLRITSRQGLQLHGVIKDNLQRTIKWINDVQLSTLGACGDVNRNVMCCPGPYKNEIQRQVEELSNEIAAHLAPRSGAYHEIWLRDPASGEKELVGGGEEEIEPIYGKVYLPRKFKIAIGFPHDNCVDLYTNDVGLLAVIRDDKLIGYNVLAGGGQGVTPAKKTTYPALAHRLCFASPAAVLDVVTAIVKVQRDFGNRADRKQARMKYLIADWGLEKFRDKVAEYYGGPLEECQPEDVHGFHDHIGWEEQGDGSYYYGLNVENGRIADTEKQQLKSALREICSTLAPGIRLTSHQALLFTDIAPENREKLEEILKKHNVPLSEEISTVRRWSMACVAWPTCGLSITESERALPGVIDEMEAELAKLGLSQEAFTVRMTGCPNGCARPYNCDIGLVGKAKNKYTVLLGGRLLGNRLNWIYKDLVPGENIVSELVPIFAYFKQHRQPGETLGDFCDRKGKEDLLAFAQAYMEQAA